MTSLGEYYFKLLKKKRIRRIEKGKSTLIRKDKKKLRKRSYEKKSVKVE